MKPFVVDHITDAQLKTLEALTRKVVKIPEKLLLPKSVEIISCHHLAHALSRFDFAEPVYIEDGYYLNSFPHSWLTTPHGPVYDPYPVGTLPGSGFAPLFVAFEVARKGLYMDLEDCRMDFLRKREETGDDITYDPDRIVRPYEITPDFEEVVEILVKVMK